MDEGAVPWLHLRHSGDHRTTVNYADFLVGRAKPATVSKESMPEALYIELEELRQPGREQQLRALGLDPAALERYFRARIVERLQQR
jgi:hypothetical protein